MTPVLATLIALTAITIAAVALVADQRRHGRPDPDSCRSCAGTGRSSGVPYMVCPRCLGQGR